MDTQKLLEAPKPKVKIVAKVSKINNLVEVSTQARKTSTSLRKTFEKGAYQRKTQLSVLNRYKKRLDSIQKEQDKKYERQIKKKPSKVKIPKFAGSFFTKGSADDPFKAIGALAAFNSLDKLLEGDFLGALSPGMVAAGALLGPGLVGGAIEGFFNRGAKPSRGFDVTGRRASTSSQQRYLSRHGDDAFKKRFGKDALKRTKQGSQVASTVGNGGRVAKAFGKFGSAMIPGVGAVVGAADAVLRAQSGDTTGAAIAGAGAGLDAAAAASAATGIGLPVAGLLSIASFALDVTNLVRDITGMSAQQEQDTQKKLDTQEKQQKELTKPESNLTFAKSLISYEKALVKFQLFATSFNTRPKSDEAYRESFEPGIGGDTTGGGGGGPKASAEVLVDAASFRQTFPLPAGTPANSSQPFELQLRENTGLGNLGNDPTVDDVHVKGSAHYSNRAIDIPINNMDLGDRVAKFWQDKGYYVLWRTSGHYNHVHVQWAEKKGASSGIVASGPKTGYPVILHGEEAIIPIDNKFTQSGGDPLKNIPASVVSLITSKSKIYQTAFQELPPEVVEVPMPIMPPQIQYVSSGSGSLNIEDDADKKLLKMLFYSALG